MSSASTVNGASAHNERNEWNGAFAFTNIGLAGKAFEGDAWRKHARKLRQIFLNLLTTKEKPQGILLCEVGNRSEPITRKGKKRLEDVLTLAFEDAGAPMHGAPQFYWSEDETMAAFNANVHVKPMEKLANMSGVDNWRTVERFKVVGATAHGTHTLLIYNQHQPSSNLRPFGTLQRRQFCKAILKDAMSQQYEDASIVGFGFGGDANCGTIQWTTAFRELPQTHDAYGDPYYMLGRRRKGGDLMIGCARRGRGVLEFCVNTCDVIGREEQHDPMIMQWRFKSVAVNKVSQLSAQSFTASARGAQEHAMIEALERSGAQANSVAAKKVSQLPAQSSTASASCAQEHATIEALERSGVQAKRRAIPRRSSETSAGGAQRHPIQEEFEPYRTDDNMETAGAEENCDQKTESDEDRALSGWLREVVSEAEEHANVMRREARECSESEPDGDNDQNEPMKESTDEIGLALALSLSVLPEFSLPENAGNCIDGATADTMHNACSEVEIEGILKCMEDFFLKQPELQSTASTTDIVPARTLKSAEQTKAMWTEILSKRRLVEPDDTAPITDRNLLARMHGD